ncbi:WhiB family transcriptional regulator [uncultured Corynebacterium sp.]|uniref:WhiB family transcriptional regulator n=1 Tax=uncultured Corynebacterium sp. TaxID=159447 RepID=UPI00344F5E8D
MTWVERAQCVGCDPREWDLDWLAAERFTNRKLFPRLAETHATHVCSGCPVKRECALDAIEYQDVGVIRAGVVLRDGKNAAHNRAKLVFIAGQETRKRRKTSEL